MTTKATIAPTTNMPDAPNAMRAIDMVSAAAGSLGSCNRCGESMLTAGGADAGTPTGVATVRSVAASTTRAERNKPIGDDASAFHAMRGDATGSG